VMALIVMHLIHLPSPWIPFGSLTIANICSTAVGFLLLRRGIEMPSPPLPELKTLVRLGGVLLLAEALVAGAALASDQLVLLLVSAETLGFAAAASAVARPVVVFSIGIGRVLAPRMMQAGMSGSRSAAIRMASLYVGSLFLVTALYSAAVGWSYDLNPMQKLVPTAYQVSGLVVVLGIGLTLHRCAMAPEWLLLGARKSKTILWIAVATSIARLAGVATLAPAVGAFATAGGYAIDGVTRGAAGWRAAQQLLHNEES
jgi:hypothetical protein